MTERIEQIIQEIHLKFQIAKEDIKLLKEEKVNLLNRIDQLQNDKIALTNELKSNEEIVNSLHSEIEDLKKKLNQPITQSLNHDLLIEELVKEIDDCISLLKK